MVNKKDLVNIIRADIMLHSIDLTQRLTPWTGTWRKEWAAKTGLPVDGDIVRNDVQNILQTIKKEDGIPQKSKNYKPKNWDNPICKDCLENKFFVNSPGKETDMCYQFEEILQQLPSGGIGIAQGTFTANHVCLTIKGLVGRVYNKNQIVLDRFKRMTRSALTIIGNAESHKKANAKVDIWRRLLQSNYFKIKAGIIDPEWFKKRIIKTAKRATKCNLPTIALMMMSGEWNRDYRAVAEGLIKQYRDLYIVASTKTATFKWEVVVMNQRWGTLIWQKGITLKKQVLHSKRTQLFEF